MIDSDTIKKLTLQHERASHALAEALGVELHNWGSELQHAARHILRHLVTEELGRDPNAEELGQVLAAMDAQFQADLEEPT